MSSSIRHSTWSWNWLGVLPFFAFVFLFLLWPTVDLVIGAFQNQNQEFTLNNFANLLTPSVLAAFKVSIQISLVSSLIGGLLGGAIAWAIIMGGMPSWLRSAWMTFSGVASNFAGVPLAFAFIATVGRTGLVNVLLMKWFDINLNTLGFNLLSFWGLTLTYVYFQMPLMTLILAPALDGMKKEWREAAANLGANAFQYWWRIGLPILLPVVIGGLLLLFANAFGAVATAYALTGSSLNIVPILLYAQIRGDVLHDPNLGYALAMVMIFITTISNLLFLRMQAKRTQGYK